MRRRDPARPGAGDTGLGEGGVHCANHHSQGLPPHTTVQTSARSERRMMHFNWSGSRLPLLVYHSISTPKAAMTCNDSSLTTFTTDRRGVYVRVRARDRCIALHGSVAGHYVEVTVQGDELAFLLAVAQQLRDGSPSHPPPSGADTPTSSGVSAPGFSYRQDVGYGCTQELSREARTSFPGTA